jgi:hypothetical protein
MELPTLVDGGNSPLEAVGRSLFLIAYLLQMEITNASTLVERYGGGYEIASIVNGRFAKIGDITYVFATALSIGLTELIIELLLIRAWSLPNTIGPSK